MTTHDDIMHAIGRLEGKMDGVKSDVKQLREVSEKRLDNHANRVASLEKSRSWQKGRDGVIAFVLSGIGAWLTKGHFGG